MRKGVGIFVGLTLFRTVMMGSDYIMDSYNLNLTDLGDLND